ncbi:hypothetical protein NDU88_006757 [Pleurodeles waltl]|uniref:Uncharacterized protein n=1 Tax=Pleurodeles waltl TaxID=8319 RepID=A0AAV7WFQ2_PLEWA|nr:hypothetical protein NDU88_006757 [Pleurodeles waltl]
MAARSLVSAHPTPGPQWGRSRARTPSPGRCLAGKAPPRAPDVPQPPRRFPGPILHLRWPQDSPPRRQAGEVPRVLPGGVYAEFRMAAAIFDFLRL